MGDELSIYQAAKELNAAGEDVTPAMMDAWARTVFKVVDGVRTIPRKPFYDQWPQALREPAEDAELWFKVKEVAAALGKDGWEVRRTRRWLMKLKVLERRGPRLWVTSYKALAAVWPELAEKLRTGDEAIRIEAPGDVAKTGRVATRNVRRGGRREGRARKLGARYVVSCRPDREDVKRLNLDVETPALRPGERDYSSWEGHANESPSRAAGRIPRR